MEDNGLNIIVIVIYLLLLVGVGVAFKSLNKDASDYFRSGGQGTWWLVGASAFMSGFSAWTFTGAAGVAFEAGWSVAIIFLANAAGFFVNAMCFAPWFRQLRAITVPEIIRDRFGPSTQQFFAWSNVPMRLLYSGLHLYGLAIFSAAMFGLSVQSVIVGVGLIVLIYSAAGGSWAVMATDFLQSIILIPITVLLAVLCLIQLGGIDGLQGLIQEKGLAADFQVFKPGGIASPAAYTWVWAAAMFLQGMFLSNSMGSASRYFAAKDGRAARWAALLGGVLMLAGGWIWFIPPIAARLLFEEQVLATSSLSKPAEAAYAIASAQMLPRGMSGLMIVAMFSATMSAMDTGLNQTAAIFTRDIVPSIRRLLRRPELSDIGAMRLGQSLSLVMGLVIIVLAWYFSTRNDAGIFEFMLNVGALLALPLAIPTLLALFVRKTPWWAGLFSIACAVVPSVWCTFFANEPWSFQAKVFVITLAGSLGYLVTRCFWRTADQGYRQRVGLFFKRMHTPVDFVAEVGHDSDHRQMAMVGTFGLVSGAMVLLLLLLANPVAARVQIAAVAASILIVSALLVRSGLRRRTSEVRTDALSKPAIELKNT